MTLSGFSTIGSVDGTNNLALFTTPTAVAADSSGNIYVADTFNNSIRKVTPVGSNYVVTTIAGQSGPGANDGLGTVAKFSIPRGIALDKNGYLYIADLGNNTIRRMTPSGTNWVVTTLAGSPGPAGSQDGTNNTAQFNRPSGLVVDGSGKIFVTDESGNSIRKITPSGTNWIVTTFAGNPFNPSGGSQDGTGTFATFNTPIAITIGTNGNLFVADSVNYTIRMITSNAVVTTVMGSAGNSGTADGTNKTARFLSPRGITSDSSGNLYIVDTTGETVRKASPVGTNWVVTTLAGTARFAGSRDGTNSAALFCQPIGVTVDPSGNIYVADTYNNTVRRLSISGSNCIVTAVVGQLGTTGIADGYGSSARYFFPSAVATDAAGNVYVADANNQTIRMITAYGQSRTLAGLPQSFGSTDGTGTNARFGSPSGIAVDAATNIYVADKGNDIIRKIALVGTNWMVTTIAGTARFLGNNDGTNGAARFFNPTGIAVGPNGNLYVADYLNSAIRQISRSGTNWVVTTITNDYHLGYPQAIAVDAAGNLYIGTQGGEVLSRLTWTGTGWSLTNLAGASAVGYADGTNSSALFNDFAGIAVDAATNIYVADEYNSTIRRIAPSGTNWIVSTLAGKADYPAYGIEGSADGTDSNASFYFPLGICVDAYGNLYVADIYNNTIRKGWAAGIPPGIVLDTPALLGNQMQFGFRLATGAAQSFEVSQADELTGPWTIASNAVVTTNLPGVSFSVNIPTNGTGESRFYRVQTP